MIIYEMIIWLCITVPMRLFKNDGTKKSAFFKLHPPMSFFVTNISNLPPLPSPLITDQKETIRECALSVYNRVYLLQPTPTFK